MLTGLKSNKIFSQKTAGEFFRFLHGGNKFYTAGLSSTSGMNLTL